MSWLMIILVGVAILAGLVSFGYKLSQKAGKEAQKIIESADERYQDFVEKYLANLVLEGKEVDLDFKLKEILHHAFVVLKPEIDGLIAHINATSLSDVKIKYDSPYFRNVCNVAQMLYEQRHKNNSLLVSDMDKDRLYEAFKDAIRADLMQRMLALKAGLF